MIAFICRRIRVGNSYESQLKNALPHTTQLFSSKFSGLSPEAASDPSSCDRKQENSQAILTLLRNHGFTNAQISKVVKGCPQVVSADPEKTLLPKLEFLSSMGISSSDIPAIISRTPTLLSRSIEKNLVPGYNFLKNVFCNNKDVVRSVKRDSNILVRVVGGPVALNVDVLRGAGVPQSRISFMLLHFPYTAYQNPDKIRKCIEDAIKMGFDPLTLVFIHAVHVKCGISKDTWDHRMEVYRKWGLSDEDILLAFRKHPLCMRLSDDKITRTMDFLVNKMSWKPAIIARNPVVLFYDLEKRIIPRCSVIKVLMSRGLIKKDLGLSSFMMPAEKRFLDRFVRNYYKDIPELIKIYLGDGHLEPEYGSEDSAAMNCLQFNLQN